MCIRLGNPRFLMMFQLMSSHSRRWKITKSSQWKRKRKKKMKWKKLMPFFLCFLGTGCADAAFPLSLASTFFSFFFLFLFFCSAFQRSSTFLSPSSFPFSFLFYFQKLSSNGAGFHTECRTVHVCVTACVRVCVCACVCVCGCGWVFLC